MPASVSPNEINFYFRGMGMLADMEVIYGPMFSGKTETLIARIAAYRAAGEQVAVLKPEQDTRYSAQELVSHSQQHVEAIPLATSSAILAAVESAQATVAAIDEAQFFDADLPEVCKKLRERGIRVIVGGLDKDYLAMPFGTMPELIEQASLLTARFSICAQCGGAAMYTYRKVADTAKFLLGESDIYEPRCEACYQKK